MPNCVHINADLFQVIDESLQEYDLSLKTKSTIKILCFEAK